MIKKVIFIIILIVIVTLSTSCTGSIELEELGIVTAIGLDIENEKIILTNEVIIPSATEPGSTAENTVLYVQSRGDTIGEAYKNSTLDFDRSLFIPHNKVIIFGEEFAKRGIGDYIDYLLNDNELRETTYLLVAKDEKAYDLLGIDGGLSISTGGLLEIIIESYNDTLKTRSLSMIEYFKYFFIDGSPVLGVIQSVDVMEVNKKEGKEMPDKTVLNLGGGAVFKSDKLHGYYTDEEMIGFNFMVNEVEKGALIVFEVADEYIGKNKHVATKGKFTSIEIIDSRTKNDVEIVDGQIHVNINVRINGTIGEDTKGLDLTELHVVDAIGRACSKKVEEYITNVMERAQNEFKIDSFGVKNLVYMKYPDLWKEIASEWHEGVFPDISYSVKVDTNIIRTGLINDSINVLRGKEQ